MKPEDTEQPNKTTCSNPVCRLAFNFALVLSIVFIVFEVLCYDKELHQSQLIPFYIVRLVYYCVLLLATVIGAVLVGIKSSLQESQVIIPYLVFNANHNFFCKHITFYRPRSLHLLTSLPTHYYISYT